MTHYKSVVPKEGGVSPPTPPSSPPEAKQANQFQCYLVYFFFVKNCAHYDM